MSISRVIGVVTMSRVLKQYGDDEVIHAIGVNIVTLVLRETLVF